MGPGDRVVAARLIALCLWVVMPVHAGQSDVLSVDIRRAATRGHFDVDVTLRHADTGWDHYANRWEIIAPDGRVIATRVLVHPHVDEQPFTRSLAAVPIPAEYTWVRLRGHDLVHGYGGREVTVSVPHGDL